MRLFHARKNVGYTLLEMTLVLAIISVVATIALKMYRDATESNRANKVALELQHVMEAALAYNNNKNYWPIDNNYSENPPATTDCTHSNDTDFVTNYLPNQTNLTSYGASVCWSGANDGTKTTPTNYQRFWVAIALPGTYIKTAQHVAALLPNAIATSDQPAPLSASLSLVNTKTSMATTTPTPCTDTQKTCYIRAEIPLPSATAATVTVGVHAVGYCVPNNPDTPGASLVDNSSISNCNTGVCYTRPSYSSSSDVYCQQLAAPNLDAAGTTGTGTDEDYRRQYQITFSCGNGLHEKLYVTPNFIKMAYFNSANDYEAGSVGSSVYSILPTLNQSQYDCVNGICHLTMQFYYGGDSWLYSAVPPQPQKQLVTHRGRGATDGLPEEPGTIGATYIAVCVP